MTNIHHHSPAPQAPTTKTRAYNFSRPRPRLNLEKPLPPLPILGMSHGMAVRRAVGEDKYQGEVVRVVGGKGGYARL